MSIVWTKASAARWLHVLVERGQIQASIGYHSRLISTHELRVVIEDETYGQDQP